MILVKKKNNVTFKQWKNKINLNDLNKIHVKHMEDDMWLEVTVNFLIWRVKCDKDKLYVCVCDNKELTCKYVHQI